MTFRFIFLLFLFALYSQFSWANYYEWLGVSPLASDAEIKKAYRIRQMEAHPDRAAQKVIEELKKADPLFFSIGKEGNDHPEFKKRLDALQSKLNAEIKRINQAFDVLKDPQQKKLYDQQLAQTQFKNKQKPNTAPKSTADSKWPFWQKKKSPKEQKKGQGYTNSHGDSANFGSQYQNSKESPFHKPNFNTHIRLRGYPENITYYEIFGLKKDFNANELKQAYDALVNQVGITGIDRALYIEIFNVLQSPSQKKKYNRWLDTEFYPKFKNQNQSKENSTKNNSSGKSGESYSEESGHSNSKSETSSKSSAQNEKEPQQEQKKSAPTEQERIRLEQLRAQAVYHRFKENFPELVMNWGQNTFGLSTQKELLDFADLIIRHPSPKWAWKSVQDINYWMQLNVEELRILPQAQYRYANHRITRKDLYVIAKQILSNPDEGAKLAQLFYDAYTYGVNVRATELSRFEFAKKVLLHKNPEKYFDLFKHYHSLNRFQWRKNLSDDALRMKANDFADKQANRTGVACVLRWINNFAVY